MNQLNNRICHKLSFKVLTLLCVLTFALHAQNITISSTSAYVGATVNYTILIVNHNQPKKVSFTFTSWSNTTNNPYSTSTTVFLSGSSLSSINFPLQIQSQVPTISSSIALTFTLTNMLNPSSLKPYLITVSLANSTSTLILKANLTATLLQDYGFFPIGYSSTIGKSSTISLNILCPNYIDKNTILSLSFNTSLISITFSPPSDSSYTVTQTGGTVLLTSWASVAVSFLVIKNVTITNPLAALSFAINGVLYFKQNNTTYNIQTVSSSITLQPVAYSSLTLSSPLYYGNRASLSVTSSCNYTQVNSTNASNPAYTIISYTSSEIQSTNISNCTIQSSSSCSHIFSNNYILSNLQTGIGNFSSTTLVFTSYTFYAGNYYPLCKSSATITITKQIISPSISLSSCLNLAVVQPNSLTLTIPISSGQAGDIVYISGWTGVITNTNVWSSSVINSVNWYSSTVNSSNIVTTNSTSAVNTVSIALTYTNPSYTTTTNSLKTVNIYRGTILYASSSTNTSTALCQTLYSKNITSSSLLFSNLSTYSASNINLDMNMQIYDYTALDYIILNFNSLGLQNQYPLAASLVSLTTFYQINSVSVSYTIINNTAVSLSLNANVPLPSSTSPILKITIANIVNPPIVGNLWISAASYDGASGGTKQTLNATNNVSISLNSLSSSISKIYLLQNNSLSLNLSNANRNILSKNLNSTSSSLSITLPSQLTCSNAINRTVTTNWLIGVSTTNSIAVGNTTFLNINLGTCMVSYFVGSLSVAVSETFTNVSSTYTSISVSNYCGDNCYQCSSSTVCTACFNSTYNSAVNLFNGTCFSTCPDSTYLAIVGVCQSCHASCATCKGSSYMNCSSCSKYYSLTTAGYCLSICGQNKYQLNGVCASCHPNCLGCLSLTDCYICKVNATLINSVCSYSNCNSPCLSCEGSQSTCTSCSNSMALYESQCYSSCPSGTYKKTQAGLLICAKVVDSVTYIPITIAGLISILGIIALRAYSNKKIGNESRRGKLYRQDDKDNTKYKINILRTSAVLFAYLELIAAVVVIVKNSMYTIQTATPIVAAGLVGHFLTNISFLIGYVRLVYKKRIDNESNTKNQNQLSDQSHHNLSLRNKIIISLSVIFTFKTYKLLYSNIFIDRQQPSKEIAAQQQEQQTRNPIVDTKLSVPTVPIKSNLRQTNKNSQIDKQNRDRKLSQQSIASRKPIRSNSLDDEGNVPIIKPTVVESSQHEFRKLNHPFLTYLTITNIFIATTLIIIGSALQIYSSEFINMLLWGVDCLLVAIISLALTAWDVWVFANLTKDEQYSEMSSRQGADVNQTHQNFKNELEVEIKIEPAPKPSPKISPVKSSPREKRLSQKKIEKPPLSMEGVRSGIKRECDLDEQTFQKSDKMPILKVFQNFDQKDETVIKQTKTKKFNTRYAKALKKPTRNRNQSISQSKNAVGQLCDDLYINFNQHQDRETVDLPSKRSASLNRSLQQETLGLQGEFEDQPPNFADISQIEAGRPQLINQTLEQDLAQGELPDKQK